MGSDHKLYIVKGYEKAKHEANFWEDITEIVHRTDQKQYLKSLKEIALCEPYGHWCAWDKSYVEDYEKYQKHKDDEVVEIEFMWLCNHGNIMWLMSAICSKYYNHNDTYDGIHLTKEMIEFIIYLHVEHIAGKDTMLKFCEEHYYKNFSGEWNEELWDKGTDYKFEWSLKSFRDILKENIDWNVDAIMYYDF